MTKNMPDVSIQLALDTKQFYRPLEDARSQLDKFRSQFDKFMSRYENAGQRMVPQGRGNVRGPVGGGGVAASLSMAPKALAAAAPVAAAFKKLVEGIIVGFIYDLIKELIESLGTDRELIRLSEQLENVKKSIKTASPEDLPFYEVSQRNLERAVSLKAGEYDEKRMNVDYFLTNDAEPIIMRRLREKFKQEEGWDHVPKEKVDVYEDIVEKFVHDAKGLESAFKNNAIDASQYLKGLNNLSKEYPEAFREFTDIVAASIIPLERAQKALAEGADQNIQAQPKPESGGSGAADSQSSPSLNETLNVVTLNVEQAHIDAVRFSADGSTVNRPSSGSDEGQAERLLHAERLDIINALAETIEALSLTLTEKMTAPLLELQNITAQRLDILEGVGGQGLAPSVSGEGGGVMGSLISNNPGDAGGGEGASEDGDPVAGAAKDGKHAIDTYAQALESLNLTMIQDGKISLDALKNSAKQAAMSIIDDLVNTAFEDLKNAILDIEGAGQGGGGGLMGFIGSLFGGFSLSAGGNIVGAGGPVALKRYAKGGIARSPHLAMFGEGSRPEAFVPLPDGRTIPVTLRTSPANDNAGMGGDRGGRMSVQIINQTGQPTAQQRTKGADGHELLQVFIGEVATDIQRNGKVGQSITNTYGINRAAR